jgi:hypothetical protein
MAAEHDVDDTVDHPDWGVTTHDELQMADGGPRYTETPTDPYGPGAPRLAEPWNAATALLFVAIVIAWAWRLRGRYARYPFLCCCMPVLFVGGVGGALYHGLRTSRTFLLMDVIPISALGLAGSVFLALRLSRRWAWVYVLGTLLIFTGVNVLLFRLVGPQSRQLTISLFYVSLAALILTPIGLTLVRSRFRHGGWVVSGLVSFAIALFFRWLDAKIRVLLLGEYLPMGSHWLWHTFGAITTVLIVEYFYRVEGEKPAEEPHDEYRSRHDQDGD